MGCVHFVHERGAAVENRTLIEGGFVGDFAGIERRGLVEKDGAQDAIRVASSLRGKRFEERGEFLCD